MALCLHQQGADSMAVLTINRDGSGGCHDAVRSQLRALFDKPQTRRQAEPVRMLLRLSRAVRARRRSFARCGAPLSRRS